MMDSVCTMKLFELKIGIEIEVSMEPCWWRLKRSFQWRGHFGCKYLTNGSYNFLKITRNQTNTFGFRFNILINVQNYPKFIKIILDNQPQDPFNSLMVNYFEERMHPGIALLLEGLIGSFKGIVKLIALWISINHY